MIEGEKLLAECGFTLFKERHEDKRNVFNYRHFNEFVSFSRRYDDYYDVVAWEDYDDDHYIPLVCSENLIKAIDSRMRELNAEVENET